MSAVIEQDIRADAMLRESVMAFLERECSREVIDQLERSEQGYSPEHWRRMADLGWLGLLAPLEGQTVEGMGLAEMAVITELFGSVGLPSPLFAVAVEAASLIQLAGNEQQRAKWLPPLVEGHLLVAAALQEPGPEFEPEAIRTRATRTAAGYALDGTKIWVPYFETSEQIICLARTGDSSAALSLFMVPRQSPGISFTRLRTTNGDPQYAISFKDVSLPPDALLGEGAGSWAHVESMLDQAAALKCSELLGMGQRALDLTVSYVRERIAFGQPIGKFQAVQHHCADMYGLLQQTRVLTAQALSRLSKGLQARREVSLAKIKASEGIPELLRTAHQLHGGVGYYTDYPLERLYRRSMAAQTAYGSARWHRRRLGTLLAADVRAFRRENAHPLPPIVR